MAKVKWKKNVNVGKVVVKVVATVLALYVGGFILQTFGDTMRCSYSPFYKGLSLIGWTVSDSYSITNSTVPATSGTSCNTLNNGLTAGTYNGLLTATNGSGVLAVIGIVALASIVTEFVELSM